MSLVDNYKILASAIVELAVLDLRAARQDLDKPRLGKKAWETSDECFRFLRSEWCETLCGEADNKKLLQEILTEPLIEKSISQRGWKIR